jgi:hypothetical protein
MRRSAAVLVAVSIAAAINYAISSFGGDVLFNIARVVLAVAGGWFVVSQGRGSLWIAASVGPLIMLVDHVILKGGYFLWAHYFAPELVSGDGLGAVAGVLISYVLFLPVASFCSVFGGLTARSRKQWAQP